MDKRGGKKVHTWESGWPSAPRPKMKKWHFPVFLRNFHFGDLSAYLLSVDSRKRFIYFEGLSNELSAWDRQ